MTSAPQAGPPTFAVIIATYRRPEALRRCLEALRAQTLPASRFEVIVVDDGGDTPVDLFRHEGAVAAASCVIRQENSGPGVARNRGASNACAQYVVFTDDDCIPDPCWLERLDEQVARDPRRAYGGRTRNAAPENLFAEASELIVELAYAHHNPDPDDATFFASNNLAVPRSAFTALGGFDPTFRVASEDRDFCARWVESGQRLTYVPQALVLHAKGLSLTGFIRQHFAYGRGAWRFHAGLRQRGRPRFRRDVTFHLAFLQRAARRLFERPLSHAVQLLGLLVLWQFANVAGFVAESFSSTNGATPDSVRPG